VTREEIRSLVLGVLSEIAPEIDPARIDPKMDLREQIEIDSMDFLNFVIGVHERTGVEIPEADYPRLVALDALVDYVEARLAPTS
jgi:acyl carrier protein